MIMSVLFFILALFPFVLFAQAEYGFKANASYYQYRFNQPMDDPDIGLEIGVVASFPISKGKGVWVIGPEFGYHLGHSNGTLVGYWSQKSGRNYYNNASNCPIIADMCYLNHYLQGALLAKFFFDDKKTFGFLLGPDIFYIMTQSIIATYPGEIDYNCKPVLDPITNKPTNPIQERADNPNSAIPKLTYNLRSGMEIKIINRETSQVSLSLNFLHQINQYLFPTGIVFGVRWLFHRP